MKKIIAVLTISSIFLTGCNTSFMNKAYVGTVDNKTIVLFKNNNNTFRPQFASDCPPIILGEERPSTGSCIIHKERVTNLETYQEHKLHKNHMNNKTIYSDKSNPVYNTL